MESSCPNCGYCHHCGRSNALPYIVRPVWIPPSYPPYPYYPCAPVWISSPQGTSITTGGVQAASGYVTDGAFPGSSASFTN